MKKLYILLLLTLPYQVFSQSIFYVQGTVGKYGMHGIKRFQKELQADYEAQGIPVKVVSDFPMSLNFETGIDFFIYDNLVGLFMDYGITKGKLHYRDYSGETMAEQNISRISFGFKATNELVGNLLMYGKFRFNVSYLNLLFETHIDGLDADHEELKFESVGVGIEPGLQYSYPLQKFILQINGGYEINLNGKLMYKDQEEAYLMDKNENPVKLNWNGVRLGIAVGYTLN